MVSVFAIGYKVCGFKSGCGDGFLGTIKISSTPSFGGEAKPLSPRRKISRHVKYNLENMNKNTPQDKIYLLRPFLLLTTRRLSW
jgi:hypothetical protein